MSVDPAYDLERALHKPQGWNRYSYVENNPINLTDPNGKCVNVARCAWDFGKWVAPIVIRIAGREVAARGGQALLQATQQYAMQRLSGFTYAQSVVIPTQFSEAQEVGRRRGSGVRRSGQEAHWP